MRNQIEGLLKKYNQRQNLLVISEYARYRKGATGLASFSQNTIDAILPKNSEKEIKTKIIVLANIIDKQEIYEEDGKLVIRCIKRNSLRSLLSLCKFVTQFSRVKNILCEFEFAAYGGIKIVSFFPLLLLYLRLVGRRVCFVLHQVVVDLDKLSEHLGMAKDSFKLKILQQGLHIFYTLVGLLADEIIVLEEEFKQRISRFVPAEKVTVIPHGVPQIAPKKTKNDYRLMLNVAKKDFVVLLFGYVTWYKGTDRLIEVFRRLPEKIGGRRLKLLIAGGKSNAQAGKPHYASFFRQVEKNARKNERIILTGFVPEAEIEKYYLAADLCVFPYRELISSSGPLSQAIGYRKPIILANELSAYTKSSEIKQGLRLAGLKQRELFILLTAKNLEKAITRVITDKDYTIGMNNFLTYLRQQRSWEDLGGQYFELIFSQVNNRLYSLEVIAKLLTRRINPYPIRVKL